MLAVVGIKGDPMRRSTISLTFALIAGSLVAGTLNGASATTPTTSLAGAASATQCGTLTVTSATAEGDTQYAFTMPDGSTAVEVDPAASLMDSAGTLDVSKLTSDRAVQLGLGPIPSDAASYDTWAQVARGQRHLGKRPAPCIMPGVRAAQYLKIWDGFAARGATTGHTYYGSSSAGTIPSYYLSKCTGESMTQWVGVSETNLAQAGYVYDQYSGTLTNYPFYEFVGGSWETPGTVNLGYPTIAPGQRFFFSARYTSRYLWTFVVSNLDTTDTTSIQVAHSSGGGTQYLGHDGVFISERLSEGGAPTQYMDHSEVRFRNATVYLVDGTSLHMSDEAPDPILMTRDGTQNGHWLGAPANLDYTSSNFSEYWNDCA